MTTNLILKLHQELNKGFSKGSEMPLITRDPQTQTTARFCLTPVTEQSGGHSNGAGDEADKLEPSSLLVGT